MGSVGLEQDGAAWDGVSEWDGMGQYCSMGVEGDHGIGGAAGMRAGRSASSRRLRPWHGRGSE